MSDKITTTTTYVASGSAFFLSFINEYAAALGIIIAAITLVMNWWFKQEHLKLAKEVARTKKEDLDGYIEQ